MKTWTTTKGGRILRILAGRSGVYLLAFGDQHLLVDTSPAHRRRRLDQRLRRLGIDRLDAVVLTHSHFDHAGNAAWLRRRYGARVVAHSREVPFLAAGDNPPIRGTFFPTRRLVGRLARALKPRIRYDPCPADVIIEEPTPLNGLDSRALLLPTPGHSPGSMSVIVDDEIALVGDAMFGLFPGSAFPPFAEDSGRMVRSWGALLETNVRLFLPAHGRARPRRLVEREYRKKSGRFPPA